MKTHNDKSRGFCGDPFANATRERKDEKKKQNSHGNEKHSSEER